MASQTRSPETVVAIKRAGLAYLLAWLKTDREALAALQAPDHASVRADAVYRFAVDYKVARCIRAVKDPSEQLTHWTKIADLLQDASIAGGDIVSAVDSLERKLESFRSNDKNGLRSAASKLLWLARHKDSVRIYDRQARVALGLPSKVRYEIFVEHWQERLDVFRAQIDAVANELPSAISWVGLAGIQEREAEEAVSSQWFRDRIFDQYLWATGGERVVRRSLSVRALKTPRLAPSSRHGRKS